MRLRRFASIGGALAVAAIAALASYSHMRSVALAYGQPDLIADLLPISVDGMMATATAALGDGRRNRWSAWLAFWIGVVASVLANVLAAEPTVVARCISAWPAIAFVLVVEVITRGGRGAAATTKDQTIPMVVLEPAIGDQPDVAEAPHPAGPKHEPRRPSKPTAGTVRRPIEQTRELAAQLRVQHPQITQAELARRLGISATRLRQVDKTDVRTELPPPINDRSPVVPSEVS